MVKAGIGADLPTFHREHRCGAFEIQIFHLPIAKSPHSVSPSKTLSGL
ncbi:MAG: hypothetical protein M3T96_04305 [Acidobacteriota bacterium]|nr:hypothetical protein [Acidobacteriota bacterium]